MSPAPRVRRKVVRANAKQLVVLEDAFHRGVDASSNSAIWEALLSKTGLTRPWILAWLHRYRKRVGCTRNDARAPHVAVSSLPVIDNSFAPPTKHHSPAPLSTPTILASSSAFSLNAASPTSTSTVPLIYTSAPEHVLFPRGDSFLTAIASPAPSDYASPVVVSDQPWLDFSCASSDFQHSFSLLPNDDPVATEWSSFVAAPSSNSAIHTNTPYSNSQDLLSQSDSTPKQDSLNLDVHSMNAFDPTETALKHLRVIHDENERLMAQGQAVLSADDVLDRLLDEKLLEEDPFQAAMGLVFVSNSGLLWDQGH